MSHLWKEISFLKTAIFSLHLWWIWDSLPIIEVTPGVRGGCGLKRMGVCTRWRWFSRSAGMLGACLVFLLAPAAARAGCGGDVHISRQSSDDLSRTHPLSAATNLFSDSRGPASFPHKHKPCSGPGCSRRPVAPMQAPSSPPTDGGEQWGCLPPSLCAPCDGLAALLRPEHHLLPMDQIAGVFHPPRSI